MNLEAIGRVRSPIADRKEMTALGVPASVEIFEPYAEGLLHLEKHSHLWVIAWLDTAGRDVLRVLPRGLKDKGPEAEHGVFAVRSPARPNPLGLTAARVTGLAGNVIRFDRLDFVDDTPVVDLKPYFVTRDMIFAAANAQVGRPADREAIRQSLLMQGEFYCGAATPEVELAAEILADFRANVLLFVDPPAWRITIPGSRLGLADAFAGMLRVRWGDGGLSVHGEQAVIVEAGDQVKRYTIA